MNPWLRLLIPIVLVLAATAAMWGPKLGWFEIGSSTGSTGQSGSGDEPITNNPAADEGAFHTAASADAASQDHPAGIPAEAVAVTVDYVHDGDTLFVYPVDVTPILGSTDKTKVRLLGIDTPEIGENSECYGGEATDALRELLPQGSTAWALSDTNPTDRYGRSLLLMWTSDGLFVNNELLLGGAATVLQIDPNRAHTELFRASEAAAEASKVGLWGSC